MKKLLLIVFVSTMLMLCGAAMGQEKAQEKAADSSNQPALTIYNQNFFVAREHVPLDLKPGVNRAEYVGVAPHLEPDSVILRDPSGRACSCWNKIIATIPSRRNCCFRFMKARPSSS